MILEVITQQRKFLSGVELDYSVIHEVFQHIKFDVESSIQSANSLMSQIDV